VHRWPALLTPERHIVLHMAEWKNEEDIKAELRELTSELRRLNDELRGMVEPVAKPHPTRAFLHKQSWPPESPTAIVADRRRRRSRKPKP
jgi:hypothetical protein